MMMYANYFFKNKIPFIADPGQTIPIFSKKELKDLITGSHILIANDYEWELVQEKTGLNMAEVLDAVDYLIVTYGENGSKIWHQGSLIATIPAHKAKEVVDPTGCGDAFRAGLMYGLKNNYSIKKSACIGAWIAAKAAEKNGTQNHTIDREAFQKFLKTFV